MLSAGTEAWKLPSLLLQLFFSLGLGNDILPDNKIWYSKFGVRFKTEWSMGSVYDIVVSACRSMIELIFFNNGSMLDLSNLEVGHYIIANCRYHHLRLRMLNKTIMSISRDVKTKIWSSQSPQWCTLQQKSNKSHYLAHLIETKLEFGGLSKTVDTDLSEGINKSVKLLYAKSSKHNVSYQFEMLNQHAKEEGMKQLKKMLAVGNLVPSINSDMRLVKNAQYSQLYLLPSGAWEIPQQELGVFLHSILSIRKFCNEMFIHLEKVLKFRGKLSIRLYSSGYLLRNQQRYIIHCNPSGLQNYKASAPMQRGIPKLSYILVKQKIGPSLVCLILAIIQIKCSKFIEWKYLVTRMQECKMQV